MRLLLLAIILFISGACSLVYQIAWVRSLTLLLGTTTIAISTVVCAFMGGLALGSAFAARSSKDAKGSLKLYAALELCISISALLSPWVLEQLSSMVLGALAHFGESAVAVSVLRALAAFLFLVLPTSCMGAALPLVSRYLQSRSLLPESLVGALYGINTVGACVGCASAGFVLLPRIGLSKTLAYTAAVNALLPLLLLLLTFKLREQQEAAPARESVARPSSQPYFWLLSSCAALVGAAGLACELVWTRLLVLTVGGSVYSFSTILCVFLLCYGLGAFIGGLILKISFFRSPTAFMALLVLNAAAVSFSLHSANTAPDLYVTIFDETLTNTPPGIFSLQFIPAVHLMALPTFCFGLFFPFALIQVRQIGAGRPSFTSYATGVLYAWNTFGAIFGTVFAALVGIPILGMTQTIQLTASSLLVAASITLFVIAQRDRVRMCAVLSLAAAALPWFTVEGLNKEVISAGSGAYAAHFHRKAIEGMSIEESVRQAQKLLYYRDGFSATVTVSQDLTSTNKDLYISTNGKIDGSSHFDMPTQKLSAHLPTLFHPNPSRTTVIGFGTGTTVGSLALHSGVHVDAVEIEAAVVEGAQLLSAYNNDPHSKDNVAMHITDARLHLQLRPGAYDIIISEPSNPWLAGVSDLFTEDFYRLGQKALRENGVFAQWVQVYNLDGGSLRLLLRSFQSVFPESYLAVTIPGSDLLLLGTTGDFRPSYEHVQKVLEQAAVAQDIAEAPVNMQSPADVAVRIIFGPSELRAFAGEGPHNTDDLPLLSYRAPLMLFQKTRAVNMQYLVQYAAPVWEILDWELQDAERAALELRLEIFSRSRHMRGAQSGN